MFENVDCKFLDYMNNKLGLDRLNIIPKIVITKVLYTIGSRSFCSSN